MNMNKRILIFDDDEGIQTIMKYILEERGWEVFSSLNSNNAVNLVRSIKPSIIMMDNNIADHGGIFATRNIKQQGDLRHIPVIYFSAHSNVESLAAEAGADAHLHKPFDIDDLFKLSEQISMRLLG